MKSFLVIGLGRFGAAAAETLSDMGYEVAAMDTDADAVSRLSDHVTSASINDAREISVLRAIGAAEFDCAIVAMGEDLAASILITMNLKELGCKKVVCKAQNETYKKALERIGADQVIIPEREMAQRLVQSLASDSFLDYVELSENFAIVEVRPPESWRGKSLKDLNVRAKHQVNVLAIKNGDSGKMNMNPGADDRIGRNDTVMIMGSDRALERLRKL